MPRIIIALALLGSAGCARNLTITSTPPGAAVECRVEESVPSFSMGFGFSTGGIGWGTGMGASTRTRTTRKVRGFTPVTLRWYDTDEPDDYLRISKGDAWVILFALEEEPAIHVDFVAAPIRISGARLVDANRPAEMVAPAVSDSF